MPRSPTSRNYNASDDKLAVLVGESNPYGEDPEFALYPAPDGCSGHRLCCRVLQMRRLSYLETFHRANLCAGSWNAGEAREKAHELCMRYERLILLGARVCSAFCMTYHPFIEGGLRDVERRHPCRHVLILPHPSGRCLLWNQPGNYQRAREAVAAFVPEIAHLVGLGNMGDDE